MHEAGITLRTLNERGETVPPYFTGGERLAPSQHLAYHRAEIARIDKEAPTSRRRRARCSKTPSRPSYGPGVSPDSPKLAQVADAQAAAAAERAAHEAKSAASAGCPSHPPCPRRPRRPRPRSSGAGR